MLCTCGFCRIIAMRLSFLMIGVSSEMIALSGCFSCMRIWPQKLNTFWLTVSWKPLANDKVTIITITLITVATMDKRMMNREKDFCWLNAILFAIKPATFKLICLS